MAEESVDDVLAHYGVLGMKWGVRKDRSSSSGPASGVVSVKAKPGKGVVEVRGGRGVPASEEAKRAAAAIQVAKKSGVSALNNDDLRALTQRLELESKLAKALPERPGRIRRGQKFTKDVLDLGNTANQALNFAKSPAGLMIASSLGPKAVQKVSKIPK